MVSKQGVQLRMNAYIAVFFLKKNQRILRMHYLMLIGF